VNALKDKLAKAIKEDANLVALKATVDDTNTKLADAKEKMRVDSGGAPRATPAAAPASAPASAPATAPATAPAAN
jgi:hypothetical protein